MGRRCGQPVAGQAGDGGLHQGDRVGRRGLEVSDNLFEQRLRLRAGRVWPPAVVVGDQRDQGVADLGLTGQPGLWKRCHSDKIGFEVAVQERLGPRAERRAFHADVRPLGVHAAVELDLVGGFQQHLTQDRAERLGELDVHREPVVEEGRHAAVGLVDDLIHDDQIARVDLLAQRTDRPAGDDVRHAEALEGVDVGPVRHLRGVEGVAFAVAGEDGEPESVPLGDADRRAGLAEGGVDLAGFECGFAEQGFAESGAADQTDHGWFSASLAGCRVSSVSKNRGKLLATQSGSRMTTPSTPSPTTAKLIAMRWSL